MPHEDESYVAVKMVVDGGAKCTVEAVQGHEVRCSTFFFFAFFRFPFALLCTLTLPVLYFLVPYSELSLCACVSVGLGSVQQFTVNKADLIELKKDTLAALADDLTRLEELNVPLVMHNLRERAKNRQIYTNVGTILISINPYEMLPVRLLASKKKQQ